MRGSLFTFAAGRRAKWIVFAIWFLGDLHRRRPGRPAGQVRRRRKQRGDLLPARRRRIDPRARRHRVAAERRNRAGGDHLPARRRASPPPTAETIEEDVGEMTEEALPGRDPRRRHGGRRRRQGADPGQGAGARSPKAPAGRLRDDDHARSPASPPTTPPSSARSARRTARRRSSPPTSRPKARANGSSTRSSTGATRSPTKAAAWKRRSPAAPASRPTRSKSSKASTGRCCWPRSAS